jgi:hypothetical protein
MPLLMTTLVVTLLNGGALPFVGARFETSPQLTTLPDNPCAVLTQEQMAAITGLEVTTVRRVPSVTKIVEAQRNGRAAGPGTICVYETDSAFGGISIFVPDRTTRTTDVYWAARSRYFETYRGSARSVPNIAIDAWLAGGADLHVLIRDNEFFTVSAQMWSQTHPIPSDQGHEFFVRAGELLTAIARAIVARL